jgi:hypothetical protein
MRGSTRGRPISPGPAAGSRCHACRGATPPGETVHVVGRCHNRDCCVTTPADFLLLIAQLAAMGRTDTARCWRRPTILTATHGIRAGARNG